MGRIRDFFFGKDPEMVNERGEIVHSLHEHTWREWDERYAAKDFDWRHHQGNYPLSHDLNFSVVDPGREHQPSHPDWRRADSDHRPDEDVTEASRDRREPPESEWRPAEPTTEQQNRWLRNFFRRPGRFQPI